MMIHMAKMEYTEQAVELKKIPGETAEQAEMDAAALPEAGAQELLEQQEMDRALEAPAADAQEKLGEYKIFCDTRPEGGGYRIFCKTSGK